MSPTRKGFLIRAAAVGGAALVRRVVATLTGRSTAAYAAVVTTRSAQSAITHGPFRRSPNIHERQGVGEVFNTGCLSSHRSWERWAR